MQRPEPMDENEALRNTLEDTRLETEAVAVRVTQRSRRITQPFLQAVVAPLPPPPALPGDLDEERMRRSEAPTMKMKSVIPEAPVEPSTRYSFIARRSKRHER